MLRQILKQEALSFCHDIHVFMTGVAQFYFVSKRVCVCVCVCTCMYDCMQANVDHSQLKSLVTGMVGKVVTLWSHSVTLRDFSDQTRAHNHSDLQSIINTDDVLGAGNRF